MPITPCKLDDLPQGSRWLVLAPHADDESIGCGGLIYALGKAGHQVDVVVVTEEEQDPNLPSTKNLRWQEFLAAAKIIGFKPYGFGIPDGKVTANERIFKTKLAEHLEHKKYDWIVCPFPSDHHCDHRATAEHLSVFLSEKNIDARLLCYEVWSTLWPNRVLDISSHMSHKLAAIRCYMSQLYSVPYDRGIEGLNAYRGMLAGFEYGEAYYETDTAGIAKLVDLQKKL